MYELVHVCHKLSYTVHYNCPFSSQSQEEESELNVENSLISCLLLIGDKTSTMKSFKLFFQTNLSGLDFSCLVSLSRLETWRARVVCVSFFETGELMYDLNIIMLH